MAHVGGERTEAQEGKGTSPLQCPVPGLEYGSIGTELLILLYTSVTKDSQIDALFPLFPKLLWRTFRTRLCPGSAPLPQLAFPTGSGLVTYLQGCIKAQSGRVTRASCSERILARSLRQPEGPWMQKRMNQNGMHEPDS